MKRLRSIAAMLLGGGLMLVVSGSGAVAEKRVALVVGNSAYQNCRQAPNPARDAEAVADMFKKAGYEVYSSQRCRHISISSVHSQVRRFSQRRRHRGDILCRARHRNRRYELRDSRRRQARERPRCVGRSDRAQPSHSDGRRRKASAARHSRCLPGQPILAHNEAQRQALRQIMSGLGPCQMSAPKPSLPMLPRGVDGGRR